MVERPVFHHKHEDVCDGSGSLFFIAGCFHDPSSLAAIFTVPLSPRHTDGDFPIVLHDRQ
jgi:hypothetical protein